jgi:Pyridine nucleotide-disulphide oxidoreductase
MTQRAQLAILGAGPIGLDAALAAVAAGLDVTVYEAADRVAANVAAWGHVRMFTPWDLVVSPRMRAALERAGRAAPAGGHCPTGRELIAQLLDPVASLPDLDSRLRLGERVLAIGRGGLLKQEEIGTGRRRQAPFRLLVRDRRGEERLDWAGAVLDCTGAWARPHACGEGGIPAPGEAALGSRIRRFLPDFEREAAEWAGRTILLVGAGHSAQTAARELARLAAATPDAPSRTVWLLRREEPSWGAIENDPLPERAALARSSAALQAGSSPHVECRPGRVVAGLASAGEQVRVWFARRDGTVGGGAAGEAGASEELVVDRVLSLTGSSGDHDLYRELQIHQCYATEGPMRLSAALLGASGDCMAQSAQGAETLVNPEPGFFILGSKSYGRNTSFLLRVGWEQVSAAIGLVLEAGGRAAAAAT